MHPVSKQRPRYLGTWHLSGVMFRVTMAAQGIFNRLQIEECCQAVKL